jgi:CubicO group peptidase (beta-lactamase class C family)
MFSGQAAASENWQDTLEHQHRFAAGSAVMLDPDKISALFAENFSLFGELGASLSIWKDGEEVVSLAQGWSDRQQTQPWTAETPVLVWSATKGPASACVLHAMQEHGLSLDSRVAEVWPEFAAGGKQGITFGQALSHQSGIPVLDTVADVFDHSAVATAIAEQAPHWRPGEALGYGPRVFGFLLDELVRRIAGEPLGEYWQQVFARSLGLDFWIGLPDAIQEKVANVLTARTAPPNDRFYTAFATPGSFTIRAFGSPKGLHGAAPLNTREARAASFPGFGGIGTAKALGRFYAMLATGGTGFFDERTIDWMSTTLAQGDDRVLLMETAFSAGFMRDPVDASGNKLRAHFGPSLRAFGHPGAGGSLAFADPENRIAFAYVMNQMEPGVLPGPKSLRLVDAVYA